MSQIRIKLGPKADARAPWNTFESVTWEHGSVNGRDLALAREQSAVLGRARRVIQRTLVGPY